MLLVDDEENKLSAPHLLWRRFFVRLLGILVAHLLQHPAIVRQHPHKTRQTTGRPPSCEAARQDRRVVLVVLQA